MLYNFRNGVQQNFCEFRSDRHTRVTRLFCYLIFTAHQWSCGKVIFSLMSVCLFTREESLYDHYPSCTGPHCTFSQTSDIGLPGHDPLGHQTWPTPALDPALAPPPSSDIRWQSLETCSNLFTWGPTPTITDIWWLKHAWLASGQYTSCWNAKSNLSSVYQKYRNTTVKYKMYLSCDEGTTCSGDCNWHLCGFIQERYNGWQIGQWSVA